MDSVEIGVTYGLHEGGSRILLLRPGQNDKTLSLRPQLGDEKETVVELSYEISAADTTLFFIQRNAKTNRIVDKIPYYRALKSSVKTDLQGGVERAINQLLITGQYQGTDSLGQPVNAYFLSDGKVKGLPFSQYTVQMDFTGPNPGDELIFDTYSKRQSSFGASFGRDTLRLYTIHHTVGVSPSETDTTDLFSRGRLRYQLVRVRKP
ncbi:hypothetical protein GCM10011375_03750 [Hymenobacter qilianensis]|uniref:Uncharacterized protein n=1 Tax=Hymenobacter qilianensis TaxID=1385715 RepID=A0ACB5PLW5_9BACT|nr:hypothetical protein [Hymenobacter qilianensis]GGF51516.1 hypothetical protein GCM10011375_03750 [Hymenobacter qilianensis]